METLKRRKRKQNEEHKNELETRDKKIKEAELKIEEASQEIINCNTEINILVVRNQEMKEAKTHFLAENKQIEKCEKTDGFGCFFSFFFPFFHAYFSIPLFGRNNMVSNENLFGVINTSYLELFPTHCVI